MAPDDSVAQDGLSSRDRPRSAILRVLVPDRTGPGRKAIRPLGPDRPRPGPGPAPATSPTPGRAGREAGQSDHPAPVRTPDAGMSRGRGGIGGEEERRTRSPALSRWRQWLTCQARVGSTQKSSPLAPSSLHRPLAASTMSEDTRESDRLPRRWRRLAGSVLSGKSCSRTTGHSARWWGSAGAGLAVMHVWPRAARSRRAAGIPRIRP